MKSMLHQGGGVIKAESSTDAVGDMLFLSSRLYLSGSYHTSQTHTVFALLSARKKFFLVSNFEICVYTAI